MKNNMNTLVVCSNEEANKLKQEITSRTTEITIKYTADNYKDALQIINSSDDLDAILVDGTIPGENILELLMNYKNEVLLSRTTSFNKTIISIISIS